MNTDDALTQQLRSTSTYSDNKPLLLTINLYPITYILADEAATKKVDQYKKIGTTKIRGQRPIKRESIATEA
jgi:hypothetical protein